MSALNHHPLFQHQSFFTNDIDQLCEMVKPWNLFLKKVDKGNNFHGGFDMIASQELLIFKSNFGGVLEQAGSPPAGMRTLWLPADDLQSFYWRKHYITGRTIGFFPLEGELDATSKPGFSVYVISLPEQMLLNESFKLGLDWSKVNNTVMNDHFVVDDNTIISLRSILEKFFSLPNSNLSLIQQNNAFISLKTELIYLFIKKSLSSEIKYKPYPSNRSRIFSQFREYIYTFPSQSFSSSELCAYTGASERSLQYVIKDYTQMTPNQYSKALKLNMIRESLLKNSPKQNKISQLALEHGFWHTAQFAADYRKQFGELPSETLKS